MLNSESDLPPDLGLSTMPEEHAGNRVFAFFFDGRVPKAANRGAQAFDRLVPEVKGFRPSIFQGLRPQHRMSSGPVDGSRRFPGPTWATVY